MEKLENDDFNFDFQQNNEFQHVSIQVMTNVARAAMSGAQCDQTFSAVITKRCAEILPNWIFFYQTRANSAF